MLFRRRNGHIFLQELAANLANDILEAILSTGAFLYHDILLRMAQGFDGLRLGFSALGAGKGLFARFGAGGRQRDLAFVPGMASRDVCITDVRAAQLADHFDNAGRRAGRFLEHLALRLHVLGGVDGLLIRVLFNVVAARAVMPRIPYVAAGRLNDLRGHIVFQRFRRLSLFRLAAALAGVKRISRFRAGRLCHNAFVPIMAQRFARTRLLEAGFSAQLAGVQHAFPMRTIGILQHALVPHMLQRVNGSRLGVVAARAGDGHFAFLSARRLLGDGLHLIVSQRFAHFLHFTVHSAADRADAAHLHRLRAGCFQNRVVLILMVIEVDILRFPAFGAFLLFNARFRAGAFQQDAHIFKRVSMRFFGLAHAD